MADEEEFGDLPMTYANMTSYAMTDLSIIRGVNRPV